MEGKTVDTRETQALILKEGQHIGSIRLHEYRVAYDIGAFAFWGAMDADSHTSMELADVVNEFWDKYRFHAQDRNRELVRHRS